MKRQPRPSLTDVSFEISNREREIVDVIADRAAAIYKRFGNPRPIMDIQMDLIATHANGCPMDFARLADADDTNLIHDVGGICRHLDRTTGQLTHEFLPRFAMKTQRLEPGDGAAIKTTVLDKLDRLHKKG